MSQIVTLTMNPALDKSAPVSSVMPEIKMRCGDPHWQPGGGGINVARVAHRLGGNPLAVFPRGGHTGQLFEQLLAIEEVDTHAIPILGSVRESLAIYEESTGQQYRFNFAGPTLAEAEWKNCIAVVTELLEPNTYLVLSGSLPPGVPHDFYCRLIEAANTKNVRVILDSTGEPLRSALEAGVFLIKPNLRELHLFAGRVIEEESEQEEIVQQLIGSNQCQAAVVSLGSAGVMLATHSGIEYIRAPTVPIRSKVGAGDSTVGGIVWSLAQGHPLETAVCYGVAAGSACVMTPGTELAYKEDVDRLFKTLQE